MLLYRRVVYFTRNMGSGDRISKDPKHGKHDTRGKLFVCSSCGRYGAVRMICGLLSCGGSGIRRRAVTNRAWEMGEALEVKEAWLRGVV